MPHRRRKRQSSIPLARRPLGVEALESRALLAASVLNFENINLTNPWAEIRESLAVEDDLYFIARDHGRTHLDLWKTDGTSQGTTLLANLGPNDQQTRQLTNIGGTLYFRGHSPSEGFELWKSNGTVAGTAMVRALKPGLMSSILTDFTNLQGTLYFSANGELIKTNGTSAGTARVKDLHVGSSDEVSHLEVVGNTLYFTAKSPVGTSGVSLYQTTGTNSSTRPVASASGTTLAELTQVGSQLFFTRNGYELWKYDPANPSAEQVYASFFQNPLRELAPIQGNLFFVDGQFLMKTDGTAAGTDYLIGSYEQDPQNLFASGNVLYFSFGDRGRGGSGNGQELWRSDGTVSGTVQVKNINPRFNEGYGYGSYPNAFVESGGTLYFQAFDGLQYGLWTTDGTEPGTRLLAPTALPLADVNGQFFYSRFDGGNVHLMRWPAGQDTPIEVTRSGPGLGNSNPSKPISHLGKLYFFAEDGIAGHELRRRNSDGTIDLVADISPGPAHTLAADLESANGLLYFTVIDSLSNPSLWRSDGTAGGTFRLASVRPTSNRTDVNAPRFVPVNQTLYFSGQSPDGGELWKSDGTVAGTVQVKDIFPGSTYVQYEGFRIHSSLPAELTNFQGTLVFAATDGTNGRELWKSDGTTAGTTLLVDHHPGGSYGYPYEFNSSFPFALRQTNDRLHYMATDETGVRFFESDGTPEGSLAVSPVIPTLSSYQSPKVVGDRTFFVAETRTSRQQLWVSDGTVVGTKLVKDIRLGRYPEQIANMTDVDGVLFFTADDGIHGMELWKSDGTPEGTVLVEDIAQGLFQGIPASSRPTQLTSHNGILFFSASNGSQGHSLWRTNGTADGVTLISGNGTANPSDLISYGNRLLFAGDSTLGRELFQISSAPPVLTLTSTSITYTEGEPAKLLARNATLTDADSPVLEGGLLTVALQGPLPGEELRILNGIGVERIENQLLSAGVVFGTVAPTSTTSSLVIHLNQHATVVRIQRLLQVIAYRSSSHDALASNRIVRFTLTDGEAGIARKNVTVQYVPVNDAPTLAGLAPVRYQRNRTPGVAFAANASVNDIDSSNFGGGELRVSVQGGEGASNRIILSGNLFSINSAGVLRRGSLVIGTVAPNSGIGTQAFVVQFNASTRPSMVAELLKALRFETSTSLSNQARTISMSLRDGDGGLAQATVRVTVTN